MELSSFYAFRREGPKIFEKIILPDMLEPKSNHCLFEIPHLNAICALGGKNSKDVEVYNLEDKTCMFIEENTQLNIPDKFKE